MFNIFNIRDRLVHMSLLVYFAYDLDLQKYMSRSLTLGNLTTHLFPLGYTYLLGQIFVRKKTMNVYLSWINLKDGLMRELSTQAPSLVITVLQRTA